MSVNLILRGNKLSQYQDVPNINKYLSNGVFTLTSTKIVSYLIVAGGGGSGEANDYGYGGGGAGGYKLGRVTLSAGSYQVIVGDGGLGALNDYSISLAQRQGKDSSFNGIIALGGGSGAGGGGNANSANTTGGSGGGGSSYVYGSGAAGTDGQGFSGGNGARGARFHGNGGGGGGATEKGQNSNITLDAAGGYSLAYGGNGGAGIKIDSTNLQGYNLTSYFAGGGGGSTTDGPDGVGGIGGGGNGSNSFSTVGTPNTGGGGGAPNKAGGSGIVILIYNDNILVPYLSLLWPVNMEVLLGNMYNDYKRFKICLNYIASSTNDKISVNLSGLPFTNAYNLGGKNNSIVTIASISSFYTSSSIPQYYQFTPQQLVNIFINLIGLDGTNISSTDEYIFSFNIIGDENFKINI